jgi:Zn-dependent peptidase ImmA (M78 family)
MPTTRLAIDSPRLKALVHEVFNGLPDAARQAIGASGLAYITDNADQVNAFTKVHDGVCQYFRDGSKAIVLNPRLLTRTDEHIKHVVAHELAHTVAGSDEDATEALASVWGHRVSDHYPKVSWK